MRRAVIVVFLFFPALALPQGTVDTISFYSNSLGELRNVCVYLPEGYDPGDTVRYPVVYFLHDFEQNHTNYPEIYTCLDSIIDDGRVDPLILVKPDGDVGPFYGSFFSNSELYGAFEDYIANDLVAYIDSAYKTLPVPSRRAIMGYSMGGYGAIMIALKHYDEFCAVASHNGFLELIVGLDTWLYYIPGENGAGPPYTYNFGNGNYTNITFTCAGAFSPNLDNSPYQVDFPLDSTGSVVDTVISRWRQQNPPTLAAQVPVDERPAIYFDCNYGVTYYLMNAAFSDSLALLNFDYAFVTFPGSNYDPGRFPFSLTFLAEPMAALNHCNFRAEPLTGQPSQNFQFQDMSDPQWTITSWEWDFNNDGIIDSYDQNPQWTYDAPGLFDVKLTISCDSSSRARIKERYIRIFDGESAILFDGQESSASVRASQSIDLTDQFTLEAWIKPAGWGENPGIGFGRIFDKGVIRLFTLKSNPLLGNNTLCLWLSTQSGSSFSAIPESSIVLDSWQHVAASYYGPTGEVKMYLNGLDQPLTQTVSPSGPLNDNLDVDLFLGNSSSLDDTFDGVIDEARVWNSVRTPVEIQSNMDHYLQGNEAGLTGYWRMNEGNGQFIHDFTANGNDAILGETEWVQGVPLGQTSITDGTAGPADYDFGDKIFPNPFNSSATVSYFLPGDSDVEITVFNILGQEIRVLLNEIQSAGQHEITWRTDDEPSGIYFYKIRINGIAKTGKMLLLK